MSQLTQPIAEPYCFTISWLELARSVNSNIGGDRSAKSKITVPSRSSGRLEALHREFLFQRHFDFQPIRQRHWISFLVSLDSAYPFPALRADGFLDQIPIQSSMSLFEVDVMVSAETYDIPHVAEGNAPRA